MALTPEEIAWHTTRQDCRVFVVAHGQRVGANSFFSAIEWYWYTPGTTRNRFCDVWTTTWHGMGWGVIAFPAPRLPAARNLAKRLALHISNGKPAVIDDGRVKRIVSARPSYAHLLPGVRFFPGAALSDGGDNTAMFTVEQDPESPVYKVNLRDNAAMLQADDEINGVLNRGVRLTPAQIVDYIYGPP